MASSTRRGVVLTFDDGMYSVISDALPILTDYGACAHILVTTNVINSERKWPQQPPDVPGFEMSGWRQLEDFRTRVYLRMRWLLRTIRGSHCISSYDD